MLCSFVGTAHSESSVAKTSSGVHTISLQERQPLAFLLGTPTGQIANIRSSEIIRAVTNLLREHTNFSPELTDSTHLTSCKGRLGCLVEAVRGDYHYESMLMANGEKIPFEQHLRSLTREKVSYPQYLIVMSNITLEGAADRISVVLVDTDLALEVLHNARRDQSNWREDAEARISETAVRFGPNRTEVRTADEANALLDRLFTKELSLVFQASANWEPYGEIVIHTDSDGHAIVLDGTIVGTTAGTETRITHVTQGPRALELQHPKYETFSTSVEVVRGKSVEVRATLERSQSSGSSIARSSLFWGGIGAAAIGTTLLVLAIAQQDGGVRNYCFSSSVGCEAKSSFVTSGYDPGLAADLNPEVNPSGLLMAPLGYSLMLGGGTWTAGTMLFGSEDDFPWIPLVAGVVVGGLSYGLSAALNSPSGSEPQ
jgi:hypothetical protein